MSLENIVAGDYGQAIELTMLDSDTELAADISGYSTIQMIFTDPDDVSVTKTAAFKTDGSDGVISYTVESGLLTAGIWSVRGRVSTGSAQLTSTKHKFEVIS